MSLKIYDETTLFVINEKGRLKVLKVPFRVTTLKTIEGIKINTLVLVEAVAEHDEFKITYRILNKWMPYSFFKITIAF